MAAFGLNLFGFLRQIFLPKEQKSKSSSTTRSGRKSAVYRFSKTSLDRLSTCHPDLQALCHEIIKDMDITILEGHRGATAQNAAYTAGRSKLKFPQSKHNRNPSHAVDIAPYPIDWEDTDRFYLMIGIAKGAARQMGIKIRSGGDWDSDGDIRDQTFNDLPHIELEE